MKYSSLVRDTNTVSVRTRWSTIRSFPLLKEVALRPFTLMPTSCGAERSFSEQGFIQGERRNRLRTQVTGYLTYVRANTRALDGSNNTSHHSSDNNDPDSSDSSISN